MKKKIIMKKMIVVLAISCMVLGTVAWPSKFAEAKSKYFLSGFGKGVEPDYLVVTPKNRNKELLVKGWAYKNKKLFADTYGKSKKYVNKKFKVTRDCKVIEVEMPKNQVYRLKKYITKYKIRGDFAGIQVQLLIKDGKVCRIYRSA